MAARSSYWGLTALLCACAGTPKQVVHVARADLGCDHVEVTEVADNRYAASGCGRGGLYAHACNAQGCAWVRLRNAGEAYSSGGFAATQQGVVGATPRAIIAAPPPAQREVIPAPPPGQPRQVIPAPPPAAATAPAQQPPAADAQPGSNPPPQPAEDPNAAPQQPFTPQPTPLSQGAPSAPYESEVPATPVAQRTEYPPPAPLVEDRPPPPAPSYVWVNGYWWWGGPSWVWAPGYWCAPRIGFAYVPGSWYWGSGYWWYGAGGWARPGSTLIVHRVAPRPYRVTASPRLVMGPPYRTTAPPAPRMGVAGVPRSGNQPSPAPRAFRPANSPLYRYPTSVASPSQPARIRNSERAPGRNSGSSYRTGIQPAFPPPGVSSSRPSYNPTTRMPSRSASPSSFSSPSPSHSAPSGSVPKSSTFSRMPSRSVGSSTSVSRMPSTSAPAMRSAPPRGASVGRRR